MSGVGLSPEEIEKLQSIKATNKERGERETDGKEAATPEPDSEIVSDIQEQLKRRKEDDDCQYVTSRIIADRTDYSPQKVAPAMLTLVEMGEVEDRSSAQKSQWRILL